MAEPRKYTRQTTRIYPDPAGSGGYSLEVTAWTDDAWNRALEANRRYLADLEWQRTHPFLARARRAMNSVGDFINDEVFMNKNNIRVRNAQQHPEGLKWFREGGNKAVALLGLGTAPIWAPEVAVALPTLSGTGEGGSLLSTIVPQVTSRTAPQVANILNLGVAGTGALLLGKALSDNPPTFSTPSFFTPFSYGRVMVTDVAPTDSVASANPTAPTDSVGVSPANTTAPTDSVGSTPAAAPSPEPERNDSTSQKRPSFRERLGNRIAGRKPASGGSQPPKNGWQLVSRYLWETKNNNFGPNNWGLRNFGRVVLYGGEPTRKFLGNAARDWFLGTDSIPTQQSAGSTTTANPSVTNPTDTLPAVSNLLLPNSTVVNANSNWEEWLKSRGTE